jgi:glucose-6-phosphate 1-dehydrogenase
MAPRIIPVEPFDIVVFGGTGDLAQRKLLPSLFWRFSDGQMPDSSRIVGASRRSLEDGEYRALVRAAIEEHVDADDRAGDTLDRFLEQIHYVALDATNDAGWPDLAEALSGSDGRPRVFYLATSPELFGPLSRRLGAAGLATEAARVVLEKPIGHDLVSARAINDEVGQVFSEQQIFRIDHYLGKETVQNLMALRFANSLFEPIWNRAAIDHVQITVSESIGVESRGSYYDKAGALRDMVQNHMLQLLCLVAMEPPNSLTADSVRDEKLKVLHALAPIRDGAVATRTVRGQYRQGSLDGKQVPGYVEELGKDSHTETFVAIKAEIETWRWAGVPFYIRTGKRLPSRASEIVVQFRCIPHSIFEPSVGEISPNRLVIRLQPDEGIKLELMSKDPGPGGMRLKPTALDLSFAETFKKRYPDAYERLVMDVVRGNATLFMRRDEVESAWTWVEPILEAWAEREESPLPYPAGAWGPTQALALILRDDRSWHDPST